MSLFMLQPRSSVQAELNQDLKTYAESLGIQALCPEIETFKSVLSDFFPLTLRSNFSPQDTLEELGLIQILDLGQGNNSKRISWSICLSLEDAKLAQMRYLSIPYIALRKALDIDHHWTFVTPKRDLTLCSWDELIHASERFKNSGSPVCWIVDQFL